jgi:hypothetical protein
MGRRRQTQRQRVARMLGSVYRVARVLRDSGETLEVGPWLKVMANLLSGAPALSPDERRGRIAPEAFGLSRATMLRAAMRCGLSVSMDRIDAQIEETQDWRAREAARTGRPHHVVMSGDRIGELLGVTDEVRREAEAWAIGTYGGSPKARAEAARERHKARERNRHGVSNLGKGSK